MLKCFVWGSDRHGTAIIYHNSLFLVQSSIHLSETVKGRLDIGNGLATGWPAFPYKSLSVEKWHPLAPSFILGKKKTTIFIEIVETVTFPLISGQI